MDWRKFSMEIKVSLYQCGQLATNLRGKINKEEKEPEPYQLSTSVSDIDRICQEIILLRAYELVPDIEITGEEIEDLSLNVANLFQGNSSRYVLVIDPLDGTDCYFDGGHEWAHMLGVLDQETGSMVCSQVYFPELSRLYFAIVNEGSYIEDGMFTNRSRITVKSPLKTFGKVKRLRDSDYPAFEGAGFSLDVKDNKSAAYAQIRVVEGDLGAMVMRHFHGYDTAIPSLIIEESGGLVLGDDGRKVTYEKEMLRMPLVISSIDPMFAEALYQAQKNY